MRDPWSVMAACATGAVSATIATAGAGIWPGVTAGTGSRIAHTASAAVSPQRRRNDAPRKASKRSQSIIESCERSSAKARRSSSISIIE